MIWKLELRTLSGPLYASNRKGHRVMLEWPDAEISQLFRDAGNPSEIYVNARETRYSQDGSGFQIGKRVATPAKPW
jgi:hypothetical protein